MRDYFSQLEGLGSLRSGFQHGHVCFLVGTFFQAWRQPPLTVSSHGGKRNVCQLSDFSSYTQLRGPFITSWSWCLSTRELPGKSTAGVMGVLHGDLQHLIPALVWKKRKQKWWTLESEKNRLEIWFCHLVKSRINWMQIYLHDYISRDKNDFKMSSKITHKLYILWSSHVHKSFYKCS